MARDRVMPMTETYYTIEYGSIAVHTTDTQTAEQASHNGYRVTATTC